VPLFSHDDKSVASLPFYFEIPTSTKQRTSEEKNIKTNPRPTQKKNAARMKEYRKQ
jgi:hypothetical protein